MATNVVEVPSFDFSGFYYPEILRALIQYKRTHVPEITDESDEEPFIQLLKAFALVGHLNNVLLDVVANESLLPTARLLESVRGHLALIGVTLKQAAPSVTDVVVEFSKVFSVATNIVPRLSRFATEETAENPQTLFENLLSYTVDPTNKTTAIHTFTAGKIKILNNTFDSNDKITIAGVDFRPGIDFVVGASILDTLSNFQLAINNSGHPTLLNRIFALTDGVDTLSIVLLDPSLESLVLVEVDAGTNNFEIASAGFGGNRAGSAATDGVLWNLFDSTPKVGDSIYIAHKDVMFDTLAFVFNTPGSGIQGVWEYYDGITEDGKPTTVTNLGPNLRFDLTDMLGVQDRSGTIVKVVLTSSGVSETIVSKYVGGKNIIETKGLLGQSSVTTDPENYVVGSLWNEVSSLTDKSAGFTKNGEVSFSLPQNLTQNWIKAKINNTEGHWLRFRVVSVNAPVNPIVDTLRIDTGKQYLLVNVVQGQTVAEAPLGSSNGAADQELELTYKPMIEGSLQIEIDEGSGFELWNQKENFLNSSAQSKDYTVEITADDTVTITFGDGIRGKIPAPGVDNIRAIYRIGADSNGNVGAGTINVNKSSISFVNRVFNPRQAGGWTPKEGSTDEDLARLKIEGPASVRTLGRAITPEDIEFLATQYTDANGARVVERALAIEESFGIKTIELVVVGQGGNLLTEAQRTALQNYFNGDKASGIDGVLLANHEVVVVNYTPRVIDVSATVTGGNAATITNAVKALLNPSATFGDGSTKRWTFGAEIPYTVIIAEIFEVDAVNIKKVQLTTPTSDIILSTRELPLAGNVTVTVV